MLVDISCCVYHSDVSSFNQDSGPPENATMSENEEAHAHSRLPSRHLRYPDTLYGSTVRSMVRSPGFAEHAQKLERGGAPYYVGHYHIAYIGIYEVSTIKLQRSR